MSNYFYFKKTIIILSALLLVACQGTPTPRGEHYYSPNYSERPDGATIDTLIIHHTVADADETMRIFTDTSIQTSAHYLITKSGDIIRFVPEEFIANHAGASYWQGKINVNETSIGIELENSGEEPFTAAQMQTLSQLATDIIVRYHIRSENVIGHSDIAPMRKDDPSGFFDWEALSMQGVGLWPDKNAIATTTVTDRSVAHVQNLLSQYGYPVSRTGEMDEYTTKAIEAFQRHFRSDDISGEIDDETIAILQVLVDTIEGSAHNFERK